MTSPPAFSYPTTIRPVSALRQRLTGGAWCIALVLASVLDAGDARAQSPEKPLRIVIPAPPGGVADMLARLLGEQLGLNLKQTVIVDSKAGASGSIAVQNLIASGADGSTLLLSPSAVMAEVPHVVKVPFDPLKDTIQIAELVRAPLILVANPALPAQNLEELVRYAKANPGKLSVSSYSTGTRSHYAALVFNNLAGIDLQHVPYKGSPPAIADLLAGHIPLSFDALPNVIKQVQAGKLKAMALIATKRVEQLPDTPTFAERGFADMTLGGWMGVWVSAATPEPVVRRMQAEVAKAFAIPKIRERLADSGYTFSPVLTLEQQQKNLKDEFEKNANIVKTFNIKAD